DAVRLERLEASSLVTLDLRENPLDNRAHEAITGYLVDSGTTVLVTPSTPVTLALDESPKAMSAGETLLIPLSEPPVAGVTWYTVESSDPSALTVSVNGGTLLLFAETHADGRYSVLLTRHDA